VHHRRIIAGHADESTERDCTDRVGGLSELETGQYGTEAKCELKYPDTEVLRDKKVAELVHEDEDAED
jgi:hypothetical protein